MVDRHHLRAEPMRLSGHAERAPERVVEDDDVGADRAEGLAQRPGAEREPVAVGGGELERAQLVPPAHVALAPAGYDQVVLERSGLRREARLLVEVGTDAAASLGVEQGDIADDQAVAGGVRRGDRTVHGDNGGTRRDEGC